MNYRITIQGKGGHGSRPDLAYNPIDCFAAVYGALVQLRCRFTQVDGGTAVNVIPDKLVFTIEFDGDIQTLEQILVPSCQLYHCSFEIVTL